MIKSDAELQQSLEQMERMYRALAHLRADIAPQNYANFQLLAEGPIDEIRKLREEIDAYLGINVPMAAGSGRA
jgi:hypothetical protein